MIKPAPFYIDNLWLSLMWKILAAAVAVVLLLRYRAEIGGIIQALLRSLIKPH